MLKKRPFEFPGEKAIRVICDTDAYNECDDQFCVAHLWMTPRFDVEAMIAAQYGHVMNVQGTEQKSYDELVNLATLMDIRDEVNILHGGVTALPDENTPVDSEGARFIIEEAMKDDPRPLFVCFLGPTTEIASAYLMEPRIADKLTVVWIGGGAYPEGNFEFNQGNDINAARVLYKSNIELWQVPMNVYTTMKISYFEMMNKIYPCGKIGKYLVEHAMDFGKQFDQIIASMADIPAAASMMGGASVSKAAAATSFGGELWSLGDSPVVGIMLNNTMGRYEMHDAPGDVGLDGKYDWSKPSSRKVRVYKDIDSHFILNDMIEKLQFYFG